MARVPHFEVPLRMSGPSFAVVEQDSPEEVEQCVLAVLETPQGSRIDAPGFGRPDLLFAQLGADTTAQPYLAAVDEWEPRSEVVGEALIEELTERIVIKESA